MFNLNPCSVLITGKYYSSTRTTRHGGSQHSVATVANSPYASQGNKENNGFLLNAPFCVMLLNKQEGVRHPLWTGVLDHDGICSNEEKRRNRAS
jgi:hypothetical protein